MLGIQSSTFLLEQDIPVRLINRDGYLLGADHSMILKEISLVEQGVHRPFPKRVYLCWKRVSSRCKFPSLKCSHTTSMSLKQEWHRLQWGDNLEKWVTGDRDRAWKLKLEEVFAFLTFSFIWGDRSMDQKMILMFFRFFRHFYLTVFKSDRNDDFCTSYYTVYGTLTRYLSPSAIKPVECSRIFCISSISTEVDNIFLAFGTSPPRYHHENMSPDYMNLKKILWNLLLKPDISQRANAINLQVY